MPKATPSAKKSTSRKPYSKRKQKVVEESEPELDIIDAENETSEVSEAIETCDDSGSPETQLKSGKVKATEDSSIIPSLSRLAKQCSVLSLSEDAKHLMQEVYQSRMEEILRVSLIYTLNSKRKRLFIEDVELALKSLNVVVLFSAEQTLKTCPSFVRKHPKSKKSFKFHKGTVAKRQVEKIQREAGSLFVPKENFSRYARHFVKEYHSQGSEITFQDKVLSLVQYSVESYLRKITGDARRFLISRKQSTLTTSDLQNAIEINRR